MPTPAEPVPQYRLALLVDYDNFAGRCNGKGIRIDPALLKERARAAGTLVWSAVFVDSSTLTPQERSSWFASGFDICDCPRMQGKEDRAKKDSVDPAIIEKLNAVADLLPVDGVLLASADRDYMRVIQRLRDAGKRVYVIVPSADDVPSLAHSADGTIVYKTAADEASPFFSAAAFFGGKKRPTDQESNELITTLSLVVLILDKNLNINRKRYGFMRIVQALQASPERLEAEDVRRYVQFLIVQGVIEQHRAPKGERSGVTYYQVNRRHPFVRSVRLADEAIGPEVQAAANAAATAAEAAMLPGAPRGEQHPRVKRFRERFRMRREVLGAEETARSHREVPVESPPEADRTPHDLRSQLLPLVAKFPGGSGEDDHQ